MTRDLSDVRDHLRNQRGFATAATETSATDLLPTRRTNQGIRQTPRRPPWSRTSSPTSGGSRSIHRGAKSKSIDLYERSLSTTRTMNFSSMGSSLDSMTGRFDRAREPENSLTKSLSIGICPSIHVSSQMIPDDVLPQDSEGRPFVTRLVVRSEDFPKITGIGGENIRVIRELTGAHIVVGEFPLSSEEKIVVIGGHLRQVSEAFNATIQVGAVLLDVDSI